jgi:hypothetical protein
MRFYNRRLAAIARNRHQRRTWGRTNMGQRFMFGGYTFAVSSAKHIAKALLSYAVLELREGWRTWFTRPALVSPGLAASATPDADAEKNDSKDTGAPSASAPEVARV